MTEPPCTPPASPTQPPNTPAQISSPLAWKDTPKVLKVDNMKDTYTSDDAAKRYIRYAEEAQKWIVGPMPVQDFLNNFLNIADDSREMAISTDAFKDVPSQPSTERELYEPLIAAFNTEDRCPSVKFCETSKRTEERGKLSFKPDIMGYDVNDKVEDGQATKDKVGDGQASNQTATPTAKTNFGLQEIVVEVKCPSKSDVKRRRNVDPFCDNSDIEKSNQNRRFLSYLVERDDRAKTKAKTNLGQIIAYAVEAFRRQHRTHCFSLLIVGTRARFIRWDRAGAIVTESFDYKQDPETLCQFLWRFHLASAVQRGFDPTVARADEEEEALFERVISEHVALQLGIDERDTEKLGKAVERHYQKGKVTKVLVFNDETQAREEYVVSRPIALTAALSGRATRGYWCVKKVGSKGEIGFLKDTWRVDVRNMHPENVAYDEMLNKDGDQEAMQGEDLEIVQGEEQKVIRVSELHVAGDVPENPDIPKNPDTPLQRTRTDEFADYSWVREGGVKGFKITPHTHYRLILKEVGYPLSDFICSRELFKAAEDVLHTLALVYEKHKRMHRDVSLANIILVRKEKNGRRYGFLIDWEFSTKVDPNGRARDYHKSGTWAFMSVKSLGGDRSFRHSIDDDFESLFYVLIYCSVRWLSHETQGTDDSLGSFISAFFHHGITQGAGASGGAVGGLVKLLYLNSHTTFTNRFQFKNTYIQEWFRVAYEQLHTTSAGPCTWNADFLQPHFNSIHAKLEEDDRCENDLGEDYEEKEKLPFATYTSLKSFSFITISGTSAGSKREFSDFETVDVPPTEDGREQKRPRTEDDSIDDPAMSSN